MELTIREAMPDDADALLEYMRITGGETGNLSFGCEGLPLSAEQKREFIQSVSVR